MAAALSLACIGCQSGGAAPSSPPVSSSAAVRVPDVDGSKATQAKQVLGAAGLRVRVRFVTAETMAIRGTVIAETPVAGTRVLPGTVVTLQVAD